MKQHDKYFLVIIKFHCNILSKGKKFWVPSQQFKSTVKKKENNFNSACKKAQKLCLQCVPDRETPSRRMLSTVLFTLFH